MVSPYARLCRWAVEGRDFTLEMVPRPSPVLVMAPHGGRIEPGTARLAAAIAGDRFSLYRFRGHLPNGNRRLHLPSHCFDEPRALAALREADGVVTVHGHRDTEVPFVMVGGLDGYRCGGIRTHLERAGFRVRPPTAGLAGEHPANLCNRGRSGRGVQLEVSAALRRSLVAAPREAGRLARAVRQGLMPGPDTALSPRSVPSEWPDRRSPWCRVC